MVGVSDNLVHEEVILLVNISYHLDRGGLWWRDGNEA